MSQQATDIKDKGDKTLLIACGAVAREIVALNRINGWDHLEITCLPAIWHNTPDKIPNGVREKIRENKDIYGNIIVVYGDCGTGGELDRVLEEEGIKRIDGVHCYAFFTGLESFDEMHDNDITCFYLTDYLTRHFDTLIMDGMGISKHPELLPMYFGNYTKLVYLAQTEDPELQKKAREAADKIGLEYHYRFTGYGELGTLMANASQ
ncbi:DUF1638 domain-containing protein [Kiloniella laminariae]|uniref:DUF1638 domain-containing protein n=1 Tax=Kiloniella laminariae TaxID=454162 RepID=A0ABT4LP64_9PROT|nr:DUF1638 domain-containing protein [Kiloniella laminariae]MCZ4282872.1 DUF1638 domain-containing protein [Kiloniella laminariae]